jgi:hypothetical protein
MSRFRDKKNEDFSKQIYKNLLSLLKVSNKNTNEFE